jgi:hypothetical protein
MSEIGYATMESIKRSKKNSEKAQAADHDCTNSRKESVQPSRSAITLSTAYAQELSFSFSSGMGY